VPRLLERRWAIPTAIVLVVVLIVGIAIARRGPAPVTFHTGKAALGTVTQTVDVTGTLQPAGETDLDFGSNGHVANLAVQAGQKVTAGTVLASLDPSDAQTQLQNTRYALQAAQAKLAQDQPGVNNTGDATARSAVNSARAQVGPAQANLQDTQQSGVASVQGAQLALQQALATAQGLITTDQQDVVAAQAQLNDVQRTDNAQVQVAAANLRQVQVDTQATVNTAQGNLTIARANLSAQQRLDQGNVNLAQADVASAQHTLDADQNSVTVCETSHAPPHPNPACEVERQQVARD
jgi:macrolide-specific efflux system membrane fusion protein